MSADHDLTLGEYLRLEREKQGLSIEQVASATKISVRLLHSLEADQYGDLPAKPFIRGFVTSYARFIGLDPREVLTQFGDFIEVKSHDRPSREGGHSGYAFEKREGEQGSRTVLGIVMGAFILFGGIAYVVLKPSLKHHRSSHAEKLRMAHVSPSPSTGPSLLAIPGAVAPSPLVAAGAHSPVPSPSAAIAIPRVVVASPSPAARETVTVLPDAVPSVSPSPEIPDPLNSGIGLKGARIKHKLVVRANESAWVRYQVDGRKMMIFILRKGRILVLRAEHTMKFQTATPNDVSISYNGTPYKPLSEARSLVIRKNDASLLFPAEVAESTKEVFPGEKPLFGRPVPPSPSLTPAPSPRP